MTILQSLIKKVKNFTTECKFNLSLKKFIQIKKDYIELCENDFEQAILDGDAKEAYYVYLRIQEAKVELQQRFDFEKYLNESMV
jgi:hypothetical protein